MWLISTTVFFAANTCQLRHVKLFDFPSVLFTFLLISRDCRQPLKTLKILERYFLRLITKKGIEWLLGQQVINFLSSRFVHWCNKTQQGEKKLSFLLKCAIDSDEIGYHLLSMCAGWIKPANSKTINHNELCNKYTLD